jgi:long-chain acyl-CoA synthetase
MPLNKYNVAEDDLAVIIYTSGTTGKSKGVMLTHRNICWTAKQVMTIQYVVESDVFLSILPLSHTYEQTLGLVLPVLQRGNGLVSAEGPHAISASACT